MKARILLTLSLCLLPVSGFSADRDIQKQQEEIEKNMQELSAQMLNIVNNVSAGINQTLPQISKALSNIMQNMVEEMTPVMLALEKNKELMKANEEMAESLSQSLPKLYNKNISYHIDPGTNELSLNANITRGENNIKFNIYRSIARVFYTQSLLEKLTSGKRISDTKITTPNGHEIDLSSFTLQQINGQNFMFYNNDKTQETFAQGCLGSQIALNIQTFGPEHRELAEDFILSLNQKNIKQSIGGDNSEKTADDVKKAIDEELKQLNTKPQMIKLFPHSTMPN